MLLLGLIPLTWGAVAIFVAAACRVASESDGALREPREPGADGPRLGTLALCPDWE